MAYKEHFIASDYQCSDLFTTVRADLLQSIEIDRLPLGRNSNFCADVVLPDLAKFNRSLNFLAHGNDDPHKVVLIYLIRFNQDNVTRLNDIIANAIPSTATG